MRAAQQKGDTAGQAALGDNGCHVSYIFDSDKYIFAEKTRSDANAIEICFFFISDTGHIYYFSPSTSWVPAATRQRLHPPHGGGGGAPTHTSAASAYRDELLQAALWEDAV